MTTDNDSERESELRYDVHDSGDTFVLEPVRLASGSEERTALAQIGLLWFVDVTGADDRIIIRQPLKDEIESLGESDTDVEAIREFHSDESVSTRSIALVCLRGFSDIAGLTPGDLFTPGEIEASIRYHDDDS